MRDSFHDTTAHWCASSHSGWSPLLTLGGSVVAAVMLIGAGLSMLGTESEAAPAASSTRLAQRLISAQRASETTPLGDMKSLQVASSEHR